MENFSCSECHSSADMRGQPAPHTFVQRVHTPTKSGKPASCRGCGLGELLSHSKSSHQDNSWDVAFGRAHVQAKMFGVLDGPRHESDRERAPWWQSRALHGLLCSLLEILLLFLSARVDLLVLHERIGIPKRRAALVARVGVLLGFHFPSQREAFSS